MSRWAVIIPAAGRAARYGRNKLVEPLAGVPVIRRSVEAFLVREDVVMVIIATPASDRKSLNEAMADRADDPKVRWCDGGDSRAESVRRALHEAPAEIEWVAVHDAARPLVSQAVIGRTFDAAQRHGAAVPATPVAVTVKQAQGPLPCRVEKTLDRRTLWAMQTPQAMRRRALMSAFAACPLPLEQVTDDAQLIELAGQDVWLVEGEDRNIKITSPQDLPTAEALLAHRPD